MIDVAPIEQVVQPRPEKPTLKETFTKLPQKILNVVRQLKNQGAPQVNNATLKQIAQGDIKEPMVIEEPTVLTEELKEKSNNETGLGRQFQDHISQLPVSELPPFINEAGGAAGLLSTNEDLPDDVIPQVRSSENAPNGYIFGAGVGDILSMPLLYPEVQSPRAILCVDIVPEVVLTGRIFTQLLSEASDFRSLNLQMRNDQALRLAYEQVVSSEVNEEVRNRLKTVSPEQAIKGLRSVIEREYLPTQGYKQSVPFDHTQRMSVLAVIRDKFALLHNLAKDGNIGVGYADMTNKAVLDLVKAMPNFSSSRNLIYMSNVIDHLTKGGTDLTHLDDMLSLTALEEGKSRGNWFIDTTQNSQNYKLRASNTVPIYNSSDVSLR